MSAADPALRAELEEFYARYVEVIDDGDLAEWPEFFVEDCTYKIVPRENWDRGLPLATVWCESKGMLKDRVMGITRTQVYAPRHYRHLVSNLRVLEADGEAMRLRAHYAVIQSTSDAFAQVLSVGKYLDTLVREAGVLKFKEKLCIFDSVLIPNSIVYPI